MQVQDEAPMVTCVGYHVQSGETYKHFEAANEAMNNYRIWYSGRDRVAMVIPIDATRALESPDNYTKDGLCMACIGELDNLNIPVGEAYEDRSFGYNYITSDTLKMAKLLLSKT